MKQNLAELVFILDRSGSMQGLEGDTIGGFNAMIEKQKKEPGEAFVSTVLFDDQAEVLHDRVKLGEVHPITEKEYYVRGCTALLDAIGGAIHHIGNIHKYARPEDVPEHTLFVITTDGMENASRRYSARRATARVPASTTRWWARRWPPSGAAHPWTNTGKTLLRRTSASGRRRGGGEPSKQMRDGVCTSVPHLCLE